MFAFLEVVLNLVVQVSDETTETWHVVAYRSAINFWFVISLDDLNGLAIRCDAVAVRLIVYSQSRTDYRSHNRVSP
jgi:hypothetical protein